MLSSELNIEEDENVKNFLNELDSMLENSENWYFGRQGRMLFKDLGPILYFGANISRYSLNQIIAQVDTCVDIRSKQRLKTTIEKREVAFKNKDWSAYE